VAGNGPRYLQNLPWTGDSGVCLSTVRSHVRGVLEKTGCHRQLDVVALLAGIVPPPTAASI
jgi:hypothetical protein